MRNSIDISAHFNNSTKSGKGIFINEKNNRFQIKDKKRKKEEDEFNAVENKSNEEINIKEIVRQEKNSSVKFNIDVVKKNDEYIQKKKERKGTRWLYEEIKKRMIIIKILGVVYVYRDMYGYYELISDSDLENFIRGEAPKGYIKYINCNIVRETIMWIKSDKTIEMCDERYEEDIIEIDPTGYINFKNGIYDIYQGRLLKHSPEYIFTSYIDCDYKNSDKLNKRVFINYINDCCNGDMKTVAQIQELLGVAISNYRGFKKACFLLGPPNSGKSTLLDFLIKLIGNQFCSNVNLHDLNERFRLAGLCGKKLNAVGEMSEIDLKRLDIFKSVTGNDYVQAEFKGKDPFQFKNKALLIFAGNNLPKLNVEDSTGAFYERINLIVFQKRKKAEHMNYNLLNELLEEKQFIINFAISGLMRLIKNNFKFTESDLSKQLKDNHYKEINSFKQFLKEMCAFKASSRISNKRFEEEYHKYCEEKCIDIISKSEMNAILREIGSIKRKKMRIEGDVVNGIEGIEIVDELQIEI